MNNIYLGLNAEKVNENIAKDFAGVGLIRSEYICRNINEYVTTATAKIYIRDYLMKVCELFYQKEVWYRFTDLTPNEISTLNGADSVEFEKWHFIGTKGVRRHLKFNNSFKNECEILKEVYSKYKNIGVIIPYIKDIEEYKEIKNIIRQSGFEGKIGIMMEIPSVIFQLEQFIKEGVDNITIGLNDLTSLMLGTYRESNYHDKLHPVIINIIQDVQEICKENRIRFSIAGYLQTKDILYYKNMNIERIIINYANLPELDKKYEELEQLNLLSEIKEKSKRRRIEMEKRKEK